MKRTWMVVLTGVCLNLGLSVLAGPPSGNDQKPPLKTIIIDPGHGGHDGGAQGILSREAVLALQISLKVRDLLKQQMPDLDVLMTRERDVLPGNLSNKNEALKWRADYANRNSGDLFISIHLNATAGNQRYGRRVIGEEEKTYYVYTGKGKNKKKIAKTKKVPVYERYRLPATVRGTQTYILARDWYNQKVRSVGKSAAVIEGGEKDTLSSELLNIDPVVARIRATQYTKYFFQKSFNLATYLEEEFARVGRYSWGVQQRDWDGLWVLQATEMPSILIETGFIDNPAEEQYLASEAGQMETAQCVVNAIKRYRETLETNTRAMNALPAQASVQQPDGNTAQ